MAFRGYLTMLERAAARSDLPIESDVAPRLATDDHDGVSILDHVVHRVGAVTIMAYRDRAMGPNGILDCSDDARRVCGAHGKPYRLGVETQPAAQAGGLGHTFHEEGSAALQREAAVVADRLRDDRSFLGLAVHDWRHWRNLRRGRPTSQVIMVRSIGSTGGLLID